jgi:Family of unknown function (DUF6092)
LAREECIVSNDPCLSQSAAVEVLAYLVTAARTQVDEAAEYAPLRLMTGAQRLAGHLAPRASAELRPLLEALEALPPTATPRADRAAYVAGLDQICIVLADCLLALRDPGALS